MLFCFNYYSNLTNNDLKCYNIIQKRGNKRWLKFESKLSNDALTQFHKQACEMQERGKNEEA